MALIQGLRAREILDSRGYPTIEVEALLDDGTRGHAAIPSGASTGSKEAVELRDDDPKRFGGRGVLRAVSNVVDVIAPKIVGREASDHAGLDKTLCDLDGTHNKGNLGANAILGVSLSVARAAALTRREPLFRYLGRLAGNEAPSLMPIPMLNVLNGGVHADSSLDFQEFMLVPAGAGSFREAMRMGAETYQALKSILKKKGYGTAVGDEGGFAPDLKSHEKALELLVGAIQQAGFRAGKDIFLALDPAASEFFSDGLYIFKKTDGSRRSAEEMVGYYARLVEQFPISSIEDGLAEDDWAGWKLFTNRTGSLVQLVGDDILVTNPALIRRAITEKIANAVLIKLNQIGTLTETLEAIRISRAAGYGIVISHRSGETPDDFIADLSVATSASYIKTGAPCRGERVSKYNRLLQIELGLGANAKYVGIPVPRG